MKVLSTLFNVLVLVALVSCSSSKKKVEIDEVDPDVNVAQDALAAVEVNGDSDSGKAGAMQSIYFAYDSSTLDTAAQSTLSMNAEFLKEFTTVEIQIEGHADERGGVQYNLALGEKRAKTVKDYLVAMGVDAVRVTTISFGKERPIAFGHDEGAWSQNRRANFVVTAK